MCVKHAAPNVALLVSHGGDIWMQPDDIMLGRVAATWLQVEHTIQAGNYWEVPT
jgi:hypothetical protein